MHAENDYGATLWPTPRAERASEIIQAKIQAGEKITYEDMVELRFDNLDTHARRDTPLMIACAERVK